MWGTVDIVLLFIQTLTFLNLGNNFNAYKYTENKKLDVELPGE